MWVEMHWIWTLINYNMKILQVAFLLLFNITITIKVQIQKLSG